MLEELKSRMPPELDDCARSDRRRLRHDELTERFERPLADCGTVRVELTRLQVGEEPAVDGQSHGHLRLDGRGFVAVRAGEDDR